MCDDLRVDRALSGLMRVLSAEVPAPFTVRSGVRVMRAGAVAFAPSAVVADAAGFRSGTIDAARVGTVIEVGAGGRRRLPTRQHESAGVLCVWRVEVGPHPGYRGPLPVIFVRTRFGDLRRERFVLRGVSHTLPICAGRTRTGEPQWISVTLDPAHLSC